MSKTNPFIMIVIFLTIDLAYLCLSNNFNNPNSVFLLDHYILHTDITIFEVSLKLLWRKRSSYMCSLILVLRGLDMILAFFDCKLNLIVKSVVKDVASKDCL